MAKTYSYYGVCYDDFEPLPTGGLRVNLDACCNGREPFATSSSLRELQHKVVEHQRKFGRPDTTGVWTLKNDPVNNYTLVICGNHYYEDIGIIVPMIAPEDPW